MRIRTASVSFVVATLLVTPCAAIGGETSEAALSACTRAVRNAAGALAVGDWSSLRRLGHAQARACAEAETGEDAAHGHCLMALASNEQGAHRTALADANRGIDRFPSDSTCHAERAVALASLGRVEEAIGAYEKTSRLANACASELDRVLRSAGPPAAGDVQAIAMHENRVGSRDRCRSIAGYADTALARLRAEPSGDSHRSNAVER